MSLAFSLIRYITAQIKRKIFKLETFQQFILKPLSISKHRQVTEISMRNRDMEAVEAVNFLRKRKHFDERSRKRTRKRIIVGGAGSKKKFF